MGRLALPRDWIASTGDMAKFIARAFRDVYGLRVFRFFGEALRQAGILVVSSTIVIWGSSSAFSAGSRAPTSTAPSARPPTPGCSRPGATCASWSPTRSGT
jgi:hypothetical protein